MPKNRSAARDRRRPSVDRFDRLVSPLGRDAGETPEYSPSRAVENGQGSSRTIQSESARNARRGD